MSVPPSAASGGAGSRSMKIVTKIGSLFRRKPEQSATATAAPTSWVFGTPDLALAAAMLAGTFGVCVPVALHFHAEAGMLDRQRAQEQEQYQMLRTTLQHLEGRRAALTQLRH